MKSGGPLKRYTALTSSTPLPRSNLAANQGGHHKSAKPKRQRDTGPSAAVVAMVQARDEQQCFCCGGSCWGRRGWDWSVQHRRARGQGGTRRPDTNEPQNLILLCGSATSPGGCHLRVEQRHPDDAGAGWAIKQSENPLHVPVLHWQNGLIFLTADGSWSSRPPTALEAS